MDRPAHRLTVAERGEVELAVAEAGAGRPFLFVHGGTGPAAPVEFAEKLLADHPAHVLVPTIPGFDGTDRPSWLDGADVLAEVLDALLAAQGLADVTVVGNSLGGWAAAELALRDSPRLAAMILIDAIGITVPGHPVANLQALSDEELLDRVFYDPSDQVAPPVTDPAAAVYARPARQMPALLPRLSRVSTRTLVLWGEGDGIVDLAYGEAYAGAIPGARFQVLPRTGHHAYLESPRQLMRPIWEFGRA